MKRIIVTSVTALLTASSLTFFTGCKKDKPEPAVPPAPEQPGNPAQGKRIFILNEGGFNVGKGTVSAYYPATGHVIADFYGQQNDGAALGDVVFSMVRHNNEYFIVVNNSGKIVVCDLEMKKKGEITGLQSPRYILPIIGDIAYVSDLTGNISVVNLASRTILEQIPLGGFTEEMVLLANNVYVTNVSRNYLYRIDPTVHKVNDSIEVGPGGVSVSADKNGRLWVLASGDYLTQTAGRLSRIDPENWISELKLDFPQSAFASELRMNVTGDTLYFIENGVQRMSVTDAALPSAPFIPAQSRSFAALEINPQTRQLFVSDVVDYVQRSNILVYGQQGNLATSFKAGVISTGFYFE